MEEANSKKGRSFVTAYEMMITMMMAMMAMIRVMAVMPYTAKLAGVEDRTDEFGIRSSWHPRVLKRGGGLLLSDFFGFKRGGILLNYNKHA